MEGKKIYLYLERPHWESTIWINDRMIGSENYLATPHTYRLPEGLVTGEHIISIRIDNRIKNIDVGVDAHSISDNTQTNWNGIIGNIRVEARPKVMIENLKITPNVENKSIRVRLALRNYLSAPQSATLAMKVKGKQGFEGVLPTLEKSLEIAARDTFYLDDSLGDNMSLWDEFSPNLYELEATLSSKVGIDQQSASFGMRDFKVEDKHFAINGRPIFLRGTLESAIFPLTGYPPTDLSS